ncbi:DUF4839 domain-containing protein [Paenisporosarcina macmurdoensis]|uniref:DUF4839 domain-containing protein n=1 Tax=Paenisporosarcina macmurdoensis TaxID=212659 RepID=A0ABW1L994_9BACL
MKKMVNVLLACIMVMTLVGCGGESNEHVGEAKTPSGSSVQEGSNYQDVIDNFEEQGFKNIKTKKLDDLITGWITKDGEVEEVSVGGDINYSPDEWVSADTEVIIKYHTFKIEDTESAAKSKVKDNSNAEKPKAESKVKDNSNVEKPEEEILTVENNKELATILSTKDETSPLFKNFAEKYDGRTIEFDGNTAYVSPYRDYKTRFIYLIFAGDYSTTTFSGPEFQFKNVDYYGLHLTGDNIPDPFGAGHNIRITAKVVGFDEDPNFILLEPVSIKMR